MAATANPFSSFDITEDRHRFILGGGCDVKFYKQHVASVPSEADECEVCKTMGTLARFKRADDQRWPWSQLIEFVRAMEVAWEIGRRDMQRDFLELMGIKGND